MSEPMQQTSYLDPSAVVHPHLYLPIPTRSPLYKVSASTPPHSIITSVSIIEKANFKYYWFEIHRSSNKNVFTFRVH